MESEIESIHSNSNEGKLLVSSDSTMMDSRQIQQLNLAAMVMEQLPDILSSMTYEALTETYMRMYDLQAIRWKVSSAVLAEAYYRVSKSTSGNRQATLKIIAKDFGIEIRRAYQKIDLWATFWQEEGKQDSVRPNSNSYIFEQFPNGEAYFREALTTPDPIDTIIEAEKKYLAAIQRGETYTVKKFKTDISLGHKNETERLQQLSRKITDLTNTADVIITENDDSYPHIQNFSHKLKQIATTLSNMDISPKEEIQLSEEAILNILDLKKTIQMAIIQTDKLVEVGIKEVEWFEDILLSVIDGINFLMGGLR